MSMKKEEKISTLLSEDSKSSKSKRESILPLVKELKQEIVDLKKEHLLLLKENKNLLCQILSEMKESYEDDESIEDTQPMDEYGSYHTVKKSF